GTSISIRPWRVPSTRSASAATRRASSRPLAGAPGAPCPNWRAASCPSPPERFCMQLPVVLRLVPADAGRFRIEGLENFAGTRVRMQIAIRAGGSEPLWTKLSFDYGDGYSELRALTLPAFLPEHAEIDYLYRLPDGFRAAMLAPVSTAARLDAAEMRVTEISMYETSVRMLAAVARGSGLLAAAPYAFHEVMNLFRSRQRSVEGRNLHERYRDVRMRRSEAYADWIAAFEPAAASYNALAEAARAWPIPPSFSLVLPAGESTENLLHDSVKSVLGQLYPNW